MRQRSRGTEQAIAVVLCGTTVALTVIAGTLAVLASDHAWALPLVVPVTLVPAVVGLLIALRGPRNAVAWVLLADAVLLAVAMLVHPYARYSLITSPGSLPGGNWALLWDAADWPTLFVGTAALAYVFPDGQLAGRRWRWVAGIGAFGFAAAIVSGLLHPDPYSAPFAHVASPLPRVAIAPWFAGLGLLAIIVGLAGAAWSVRIRFARARLVERLQLLWVSYAALLLPAALAICLLAGAEGSDTGWLVLISVIVAATAVPLAVGIAVFRYRLFDIELVFSRTLIYGTLTLTVVAFTLALVLVLDALLNNTGLASGLAAAAAALIVQPLHGALRNRVERWVYGDRSDPYAALSRLGARLSAAPATSEVLPAIISSVVQALSLSYAAIELEREGGPEIAASSGPIGTRSPTWFPLVYRGEALGRLGVVPASGIEALSAPDRRLLEDLARQSGVAVYGVRVTSDLQRSRERLVAAREEERRRVRRDLHDGLGPSLAGVVLKLAAARAELTAAPEAELLLMELTVEVQAAIAEIRRLVEGLRPAALDELGLLPALHAQVDRLGAGFALSGPETLPDLPAAIEVAAYRIASEALTNAARHSGAGRCELRVAVNGMLELEVEDDGRGVVHPVGAGLGLRSMRDRADEVGGTLSVAAGPQGGTLVRAQLPIESL